MRLPTGDELIQLEGPISLEEAIAVLASLLP